MSMEVALKARWMCEHMFLQQQQQQQQQVLPGKKLNLLCWCTYVLGRYSRDRYIALVNEIMSSTTWGATSWTAGRHGKRFKRAAIPSIFARLENVNGASIRQALETLHLQVDDGERMRHDASERRRKVHEER